MYNKRIICDIDDTISVTKDRDFENAKPIQPIIDKLNYLYNIGWEIWLVTARGQLSCAGDSEKASNKYRKQIEDWLSSNNVKYHKLSFQKFLATYYIDDKNLTPEEFEELDIKVLKSGWSGAQVELRNGLVYKTHSNSLDSSRWYEIAERFFNTPQIHSLIGETLCMEFIESNSPIKMKRIINIIDDFSKIKHTHDFPVFSTYIERVQKHCKTNDDFYKIIDILKEFDVKGLEKYNSFCHGDLSFENIIVNSGEHYLIDPIYNSECWSSYLLDITKLLHSFRKYDMVAEYNYLLGHYSKNIPVRLLKALEISQWVRVYKYAPEENKNFIKTTINKLLNEYS